MKKLFILTAMLLVATFLLMGCAQQELDETTQATEATTVSTTTEAEKQLVWPNGWDDLDKMLDTEPNTSSRVDEIAFLARDFAAIDFGSLDHTVIATDYIRDNYQDLFRDDATMELAMFMGSYLDYLYDDSVLQSELGFDTFRAIKYVYRGAETVADAAYALEDIAEDLAAIDSQ